MPPKPPEQAGRSKRFYIGIFLIITNFIVGKLALPFFAWDVKLGTAIYLFSWLMLFAGLYLSGREGWHMAKFYYHQWKKHLAEDLRNLPGKRHKNGEG